MQSNRTPYCRWLLLSSYKRALRANDFELVYNELLSGRTPGQREAAARRKKKQDRLRQEKGDFDAFKGCDALRGTDLPESLAEVGEGAFGH